jgi:hypothetical protein
MSNQSDPEPTPVAPPPIDENPSATGVVDADEEDLEESKAGQSSDESDPEPP